MITIFKPLVCVSLVLAPTLFVARHAELRELQALESSALAEMRAGGAFSPAAAAGLDELAELARAESAAQELEALRGGDISNEELTTILLVLGIIALVLIIL